MPTKLMLVDDRELFREGLKQLIGSQSDFQVVGEVSSAPAIYQEAVERQPDVIVMAHDLPGVSGTAATRELVRRDPRTRVLILSGRCEEDTVHQALAAGAKGFALLQQPSAQVFDAIRAVAQGHVYLAPKISHLVLQDHLRLRRGEQSAPGPTDVLSHRERDVFELLVRGYSNQKISRLLCISPKTVETHRAHVLRKLGVHSIVDLIRFAARHQLPLE
jgi:two-component system response regulator NreC